MAKKNIYTEESLRALGLIKLPNGQYSKAKSVQQPREQIIAKARRMSPATAMLSALHTELFEKDHIDTIKSNERITIQRRKVEVENPIVDVDWDCGEPIMLSQMHPPNEEFRRISLVLLGEPMPKQSVRSTKTGHHFQPKKHVDRAKDYKRQIANQLPPDFIPFSQEVHITKYHFVYAPLKAFQKQKGVMEKIRNGEMVMKLTAGDLDNLIKPVNDSMNDLVFKDDAIVHSIDGLKKYYGMGGCVIIELCGK